MISEKCISALERELKYQYKHDNFDKLSGKILYLQSIMNELREKYVNNASEVPALDEIRRLVAVGIMTMEQHGVIERERMK